MVVEINQYVDKEVYKLRIIRVNIVDTIFDGNRITKLYCSGYVDYVINLSNATDEQIMNEVNNLFKLAEEIVDEKSVVNKVKKLFR